MLNYFFLKIEPFIR